MHYTGYNSPKMKTFWSVDAPVGRHCPNLYWDTYLVSFFLDKIISSPRYPASFVAGFPIKVGGLWEDSLSHNILAVQWFLKSSYQPESGQVQPVVNARMDPEDPMKAPIKNSTIIYLNFVTKLLHPIDVRQ
jgi:hypothetical protein